MEAVLRASDVYVGPTLSKFGAGSADLAMGGASMAAQTCNNLTRDTGFTLAPVPNVSQSACQLFLSVSDRVAFTTFTI